MSASAEPAALSLRSYDFGQLLILDTAPGFHAGRVFSMLVKEDVSLPFSSMLVQRDQWDTY